jgi:hypothetical protein
MPELFCWTGSRKLRNAGLRGTLLDQENKINKQAT